MKNISINFITLFVDLKQNEILSIRIDRLDLNSLKDFSHL